PGVLASASAIGFYGNRGDELITEDSSRGEGFLSDVVVAWETATTPASQAGIRTALLRSGIVLHPRGGTLRRQLPLFKVGFGGRFGNGRQWQSWIGLHDHLAAVAHVLSCGVSGPVNLTAP